MRKPPRLGNADKPQLFAESVERDFGIQSDNFDSKHFDEVNQFIEDNYVYFYPPEEPDDYRADMDDDYYLVADIDSDTLIMHQSIPSTNISPRATPGFCTLLLPRGRDLYLMTFPGGRVFAYP